MKATHERELREGKLAPEDWQWSCEVCREFNRTLEADSTAETETLPSNNVSGLSQPVGQIVIGQQGEEKLDQIESELELPSLHSIKNDSRLPLVSESEEPKRNSDIENDSSVLINGDSGNDVTVISDSDDDIRNEYFHINKFLVKIFNLKIVTDSCVVYIILKKLSTIFEKFGPLERTKE